MTFKKCKNEGCEVQIEVRNTAEGWRPFEESGNKHNCQYSEYARKQRLGQQTETSKQNEEKIKNNHGNEPEAMISPKQYVERLESKYVDHTQGQKLKLKVLTSTEAEGLSLLYNTFGETHTIRFSQYQVAGSLYTIAVWYEEIPLKQ